MLTGKDEVELADLVRAVKNEVQGRINSLERLDYVNEAFLSAHYDALHVLASAANKLDAIYTTRAGVAVDAGQERAEALRKHREGRHA